MGENVEFPSNGTTGQGYLATPASGGGPGVIVIQEWWGLVPHIRDVADRFAAEGFVALAPDLYRGATTTEPDEAAKQMMAMEIDRAAKDMSGAVDLVRSRATGAGVGVIGFCMGGGLALVLACLRPDAVTAVAPFYGVIPWPGAQPDWTKLTGSVRGHYAELDGFSNPDTVRALEKQLRDLGKDVELEIHPGVDHAFFNDARPEVYNAGEATRAWNDTVAFFRAELG